MGWWKAPLSLRAIFQQTIDPRPAEYRGVRMRSQLEADFAHHLDAMQATWRYEPMVYGPRRAGYLPDFELATGGRQTFIEVKPTRAEVPLAKRRMEVIWDTHPDAVLVVACAESCEFHEATRGNPWRMFIERWPHHVTRGTS